MSDNRLTVSVQYELSLIISESKRAFNAFKVTAMSYSNISPQCLPLMAGVLV